jgi:hypothetical protein
MRPAPTTKFVATPVFVALRTSAISPRSLTNVWHSHSWLCSLPDLKSIRAHCHPERSVGAFCRRAAEGSRQHLAFSPKRRKQAQSQSSSTDRPPTVTPSFRAQRGISLRPFRRVSIAPPRHCLLAYDWCKVLFFRALFSRHNLIPHFLGTMYRLTTYSPNPAFRCYHLSNRSAQHGILHCPGGLV